MKPIHTLAITLAVVLIARLIGPYMDTLNVKENPHPKMRYDITLTVDGAPGPFDSVEGRALYKVSSLDCVPIKGYPMNPMRIPPDKRIPITFKRITDREYRATIYLDRWLDEDYFGLGVCRWSLVSMTTFLKANEAKFVTGVFVDSIISQASHVEYFTASQYRNDGPIKQERIFASPRLDQLELRYAMEAFGVTHQAKESFE